MWEYIILTFIILGAYTALAIIFAAKSIIRREDISTGDTSYYIAGTMVNLTYSVVIGGIIKLII